MHNDHTHFGDKNDSFLDHQGASHCYYANHPSHLFLHPQHALHHHICFEDLSRMDQAFAFTTTSIDKCKTFVEFIQARQQIEADYAAALKEIVQNASLQPRCKKPDIFWFGRRRSSTNTTVQQQEDINNVLMRSSLWQLIMKWWMILRNWPSHTCHWLKACNNHLSSDAWSNQGDGSCEKSHT